MKPTRGYSSPGLPLDLGHDAAWLTPALRLIAEAGVVPAHLMRWSPDRASQQIADPALQDIVGRQPDRVGNLLSFETRSKAFTRDSRAQAARRRREFVRLAAGGSRIRTIGTAWRDQGFQR